MSLLIDIGNTRLKWLVRDSKGNCTKAQSQAINESELEKTLLQLKKMIADEVQHAFYSSVKNDLFNEAFSKSFLSVFGIEPNLAVSKKKQNGITNAYEDYYKLGIDRWLAMLGAWSTVNKNTAIAVIDSGTALTVDLVDAQGDHLGGYIIPGRDLMVKSIFGNTDKVIYLESDQKTFNGGWASNSTQAVLGGADFAQCAIVEKAIGEIKQELGKCVIFLTGGGMDYILKRIKSSQFGRVIENTQHEPDLVLSGLAVYESTLPDAVG